MDGAESQLNVSNDLFEAS